MGLVYAEIELINGDDLAMARRNVIGEDEIKRMLVNALVDTGSYMLCINESIQEQLQLPVVENVRPKWLTEASYPAMWYRPLS
jgi:predicted aspartyl protease